MKVIMVMFDSLNRHMLPPYGGEWTHAPNFTRLARRTVTFDNSYVCSMPCMPARRDLHTARPSFLHRSWGPLEPFDDSVPRLLKEAGIYTHLASDHYHYWEEGGANYHSKYNTWEFFRGQEGDPWYPMVTDPSDPSDPPIPPAIHPHTDAWGMQDWKNRTQMPRESDQPQAQTFAAGLDFIRRNHSADNWFLQIETFDPHEPFFTQRQYKDLYPHAYEGRHFDWPHYCPVGETPEEIQHVRYEYAALLSMCDAHLGKVLDAMDELKLWDDTMLIVWTDHGFMLGEHQVWGKCWCPFFNEVAHTPFFVWDPRNPRGPRNGRCDQRRAALVQPALDLGPTLLEVFGQPMAPNMLGKSLSRTIADDTPVRDAALFGMHGMHVNVTDGRYVYMRGPTHNGATEYTLMPAMMREAFTPQAFAGATLAPPFSFTKGCQTLKLENLPPWFSKVARDTMLFDLATDPHQQTPLQDPVVESRMIAHLIQLMCQCDAPAEQYARLGLST
ncbi:MAG TPA: sulfatase [Tepidisphaeraceae bacterium]|jgi:arylsulfatase A-like enzyme